MNVHGKEIRIDNQAHVLPSGDVSFMLLALYASERGGQISPADWARAEPNIVEQLSRRSSAPPHAGAGAGAAAAADPMRFGGQLVCP